MKEKSDINKILEGRCRGQGADYIGFKKANESHSTGTATMIYDPIAGRTVDVLSMGEMYFFWLTRFDEHVIEIKEQVVMSPNIVSKIALDLGIQIPSRFLSTDFLVLYDDGTLKAFSIKASRKVLNKDTYKNPKRWESMIRRQVLEKRYWELLGIEWKIVFSDELNYRKAVNISDIMVCYDKNRVSTVDHMYRYLIARRHIVIDLEEYVPFAKIAGEYESEIRRLYTEVTENESE